MRSTNPATKMRSQLTGWLLLAPTILILFVFGVVPFIYVLVTGFFHWNAFAADPTPRFAGVENYRQLVFDEQFLYSVWLTLRFAFFAVASEIVLGYFLARLFLRDFPFKGFFRTIHALPLMVAPIAVGATWRILTVPGLGPLPYYLDKWFGIDFRIGSFPYQAFTDHGRDGHLALDAARHADASRRAFLDAEGALRAGRRSTAPTASRSSGTSRCRCCGRQFWRPCSSG